MACNAILYNNPGWITLPDGTKVPEDLCNDCKSAALNPPDSKTFAFEELTELSFVHSPTGVTKPRPTDNYTRDY